MKRSKAVFTTFLFLWSTLVSCEDHNDQLPEERSNTQVLKPQNYSSREYKQAHTKPEEINDSFYDLEHWDENSVSSGLDDFYQAL